MTLVGKVKGIVASKSTWLTVILVVIGAIASGLVASFIPIHPLLAKVIATIIMGIFKIELAIGGFTAIALDFLGGLPKPGKTEGAEEAEAI